MAVAAVGLVVVVGMARRPCPRRSDRYNPKGQARGARRPILSINEERQASRARPGLSRMIWLGFRPTVVHPGAGQFEGFGIGAEGIVWRIPTRTRRKTGTGKVSTVRSVAAGWSGFGLKGREAISKCRRCGRIHPTGRGLP